MKTPLPDGLQAHMPAPLEKRLLINNRGGQVGLAVVVAFLIAGGAARGATFTWNAAGDGDWSNTANWTITGADTDGVPDQDDDIVINDVGSGMRTITLDATPAGCVRAGLSARRASTAAPRSGAN